MNHHKHYYPSLLHWILCFVLLIAPTLLTAGSGADYYKTLDIGRSASTRDIKKAFRRLANKYHPDKNPGDEKAHDEFIKINRAYEVLSDDVKRRVYNQYGEEGLIEHEKNKAAGQGRRSPFGFPFGGGARDVDPDDQRGEDIEADIWLHLHEIYNGHIYDLSIFRQVSCPHCYGTGADSEEDFYECRKCGGTGTIMERKQIGIGFVQQVQRTCPKCNGAGKVIKKQCRVCGGRGVHERGHTYWVQIERGVPDGYKILLENEGDETAHHKGGHLALVVKTFKNADKRTTGFVRDTENIDDLHYFMKINLLQALVGYDINITHLDGHNVNINNLPTQIESEEPSQVTKPLSVKSIEGEGMPIVGSFPVRFGSLHVHFEVVFPNTLTPQQKEGIEKLF